MIEPGCGWLAIASGIATKFVATNTYMNRSQRRKLPVAVIATSATAATGTATYLLTPKYPRARLTPMNSVTIVRKFRRNRSPTENDPQNFPNRSMINLACPTPVTAPSRTTISWLTIRTGISSSSAHNSVSP